MIRINEHTKHSVNVFHAKSACYFVVMDILHVSIYNSMYKSMFTKPCDIVSCVFSHVVVTEEYLYILRPTQVNHEYIIKSRRRIDTIMRITKKAKMPDAIKVEYGTPASHHEAAIITNIDKLHVPKKAGKLKNL